MPLWITPFALIGAGIALMMGKSLPARAAGLLLIIGGSAGPSGQPFEVTQSLIFMAIGLAVVAGGWVVKLGR